MALWSLHVDESPWQCAGLMAPSLGSLPGSALASWPPPLGPLLFQYAWVEKHFGPDFLEQMVLTRDKTVVSAPTSS